MGFRRGVSEVPHGVPMIGSRSMLAVRYGDTTAMSADGRGLPYRLRWVSQYLPSKRSLTGMALVVYHPLLAERHRGSGRLNFNVWCHAHALAKFIGHISER